MMKAIVKSSISSVADSDYKKNRSVPYGPLGATAVPPEPTTGVLEASFWDCRNMGFTIAISAMAAMMSTRIV